MKTQKPLSLKRLSATTLTFITKVTNALRLAHTRHASPSLRHSQKVPVVLTNFKRSPLLLF